MTEGWRWPAYLSRRLHWNPSIFWHRGLWDGFFSPFRRAEQPEAGLG